MLPVFDSFHTSIHFHPLNPNLLIITLLSNEFFIYNVENMQMTPFSTETKLPKVFLKGNDPILGVFFDTYRKNVFMIYGSSFICTVDMSKRIKDASNLNLTKNVGDAMVVSNRFQNIMYAGSIGNEIVVVERPVLHVLAELPPAFSKESYGS
jgi:U3 small nucleolar RNA-associated protein 4